VQPAAASTIARAEKNVIVLVVMYALLGLLTTREFQGLRPVSGHDGDGTCLDTLNHVHIAHTGNTLRHML
jgi:hypothetical protein